jgi:hypothetical protein
MTASRILLVSSCLLAAAACGKKDKDQGAAPATAGTAAPAPAPVIDAAAAPEPAPVVDAAAAAAPAPDTAQAGELQGPFASIDAYCKQVTDAFVKDECFSQGDQMDMCGCEVATKDRIAGNVSAGGKATNLKKATIVEVADKSHDYVSCSVAVQMLDGWRVAHKAFPCGGAPVSHDGFLAVTVNSFNLSESAAERTETMKLAWTTDDGSAKKKYSMSCQLGPAEAAGLVCTPAAEK